MSLRLIFMRSVLTLFVFESVGLAAPTKQPEYLFFKNFKETLTYLDTMMPYRDRELILPEDHPYYEVAKPYVETVLKSLKKLFPEVTNLPMPQIIISKNNTENASVLGPNADGKVPYLILLTTVTLKQKNFLYFTLGHELGHLLLQRSRDISEVYWNEQKYENDNAASDFATQLFEELYTNYKTFGNNEPLEFNDFPVIGHSPSLYRGFYFLLPGLFEKITQSADGFKGLYARPDCEEYSRVRNKISDMLEISFSTAEDKLKATRDEKLILDSLTSSAKDLAASCLDKLPIPDEWVVDSIVRLHFRLDGVPNSQYEELVKEDPSVKKYHEQISGYFKKRPHENLIEFILSEMKQAHERQRRLRTEPINMVKVYTHETEADIVGILVMNDLGLNVKEHFPLFISENNEIRQCLNSIEKGEEPTSSLFSTHSGACARYYNAIKSEKTLAGEGGLESLKALIRAEKKRLY
ncbi:MAG: hypothetical protein SGJ18_13985 [Pseudomonadota bacterium]|nr:hypothetical protein [Pseudomonadota bacterium]